MRQNAAMCGCELKRGLMMVIEINFSLTAAIVTTINMWKSNQWLGILCGVDLLLKENSGHHIERIDCISLSLSLSLSLYALTIRLPNDKISNLAKLTTIACNKQFLLFPSVFYPYGKLSAIFIILEIVVCKLFQFGRV